MKLFLVLIVVCATGCASFDPKTGKRMSAGDALSIGGDYFSDLFKVADYKGEHRYRTLSLAEDLNRRAQAKGYVYGTNDTLKGYRHIGRHRFSGIALGAYQDYWYRDHWLAWKDADGNIYYFPYQSDEFEVGVSAEVGVSLEGRGIDRYEKDRRENRPRDGVYEGVLRKDKYNKNRR